MNLKAFSLTLSILITAATIYPPYLWGLERKMAWQLMFQHEVPTTFLSTPDFAPIKARAFLLGSNEKEMQTGWDWDSTNLRSFQRIEPLKRQISWEDLSLEYVLAICIAVIVGLLVRKKQLGTG